MVAADNPLRDWQVDRSAIRLVGTGLQRPECVLAEPDGVLWSADARGGVMRIDPDGTQTLVAQLDSAAPAAADPERFLLHGTLPNGLAFTRDGDFMIANFGTNAVERMDRHGRSVTLFTEIDGRPLGKVNFILQDSRDRHWLTVTTRLEPWTRSINERVPDGYVALIDGDDIRIVADGFVGTNEIRFDRAEEWLYVVESNARHISRLRLRSDGTLSDREVFGPGDLGGTPDGFAFDAYGNLWITLILAERLVALTPDGELLTLLDDGDPGSVAEYDEHFFAGRVTPQIMQRTRGTLAPWLASVTFGGPDLRTVYLGSLLGTTLPSFRSPVPGLPMAHWR